MKSVRLFAIQQVSTGLFVPSGGKGVGSHTKQEPCAARPPRVFAKLPNAKIALNCYLLGRWGEVYSQGYYDESPEYKGNEPAKGTERDASDYRIVRLDCRINNCLAQGAGQRAAAGKS